MTLNPSNVNITTVGAGAITAAQLLAGYIARTGPTGAFTDTLPSTAAILAALQSPTPFSVFYANASGYAATLAAADANTTIVFGAGMLGATTIGTHQGCEIVFTPTGNALNPKVTATLICRGSLV